MHADVVVLILILVLGCAAFLFAVLYVIGRFVGGIWQGLVSIFRPTRRGVSGRSPYTSRAPRICSRLECRKIEYRDALYCSQCGARLTRRPTEIKP